MADSGSLDLALPVGQGGSSAAPRRINRTQTMPRGLRIPSRGGTRAPVVLSLLPDGELLALARERNTEAFEVIYDRHAAAAYSLAHRMCGTQGLVDDVVQEAFLSLWRRLDRYDETRGEVRSWLLGIVHNSAIDRLRHSSMHERRRTGSEGIEERVEAPERTEVQVQQREQEHEVHAALVALPAEQRRVIELAYFDGLTHTQIASRLGLPVGTIKGRMRLGLTKLATLLAPAERSTTGAGRSAV
jgi:RNA polymerase sigma-70 factor (ECF subfamily)